MFNKKKNNDRDIFPIFHKLKIISNSLNSEKSLKNSYFSHAHFLQSTEQKKYFNQQNSNLNENNENELTGNSSLRLNGYSKIQELKLVKIGLASAEQIRQWAEKRLPNGKVFGEVLNANTLHYKTFKPHKGGLFCERIFGPLKDFECACGVKQKPSESNIAVQNLINIQKSKRIFCPVCDVEYTWSVIRRYQLGYIRLISPVSHLWYLRTNPSYLSLLLDIRKRDLETVIYCMQITTLEYYWKPIYALQLNLTAANLFHSYKKFLNLTTNLNEKTSKKLKSRFKKYKKEIQKRQNSQIRRKAVYFTSTVTSEPIQSFETSSLQDKIAYLEKSFELSSADLYPNTLSKSSRVTSFLKQKVSRNIKKIAFLAISKKIFKDCYKESYTILTNRNLKTLIQLPIFSCALNETVSQQNPVQDKNSIQLKQAYYILPFVIKNSQILNPTKPVLTNVTDKIGLESKSNFSFLKNNTLYMSTQFSRNSESFVNLTKKNNLTDISPKDTRLKNKFLINFLTLMRKSRIQQSWTSIYSYDKENGILPFLSTFKTTSVKNETSLILSLNQVNFNSFLINIAFLYLLYIIQENGDSFLKSKPLNFKIEQLMVQILQDSTAENFSSENSNINFKKWANKLNDENFEFLSKFLQTNFFEYGYKKLSKLFEIEKVFQNPKNNFVRFLNLYVNKFLKVLLKLGYFDTFEKFSQQKYGNFIIFLVKEKQESKFWNSREFLNSSFGSKNLLSEEFQKRNLDSILELNSNKKIHQFLKNTSVYPGSYLLYIKNILQRSKQLANLKNKKQTASLSLFNNIYTVSYLKGWETDKDWKYFLYYNTSPIELTDQLIVNYKYRFLSNFVLNSSLTTTIPVIGANLIQNLLFQYEGFELKKMAKQLQNLLPKLNRYIRIQKQLAKRKTDFVQLEKLLQKRDQMIRRLKLLRKLYKKKVKTSSMILNTLPVLPPDLRPILKMQNQIAASDLNRFYQRILYRNERLKKFLKTNSGMLNYEPGFEIQYAQRLLQEAVDNLIQNGKGQVKAETNSRGQPLKSLSEILKGKQGRFRQYLLGKRVDYSGRSVIVVGQKLKINECGLPFEMAMELFLPFLIKKIFQYKFARTVIGAKTILKNQTQLTWELLEEVMQNHPILLNRAPTLHRLGIQAFQPKLIEGRTILLHPLVCPAFNADFDGDQMAVHVPITVEARTEAWKLMFSRNHLISSATGEPMLLPSQDMVLGCYYLTTEALQYSRFHNTRPFKSGTQFYFLNMNQILQAYLQEKIHLQTPIWIQWNGVLQMQTEWSSLLEIRLDSQGDWFELRPKMQKRFDRKGSCLNLFVRTTAGRVLLNSIIENCIKNG